MDGQTGVYFYLEGKGKDNGFSCTYHGEEIVAGESAFLKKR